MQDAVIPEYFLAKVSRQFGEPGHAWAADLPRIIGDCSTAWQLSDLRPVEPLSINYVGFCTSARHGDVVLKIQAPHSERYTEIEALQLFNGRRCCPILALDLCRAAFLLRRIRPGTTLRMLEDPDQQLEIGAAMMRSLPVAITGEHALPSYCDWLENVRKNLERGDGPSDLKDLLRTARCLFDSLPRAGTPFLLHGDLHHDNILRSGTDEWMAIDPQGVVGPACLEAGRFIENHAFPEGGHIDLEKTIRTVEQVSRLLAQPYATIAKSLIVLHTLSVCWDWEMRAEPEELQRAAAQCIRLLGII